ncbi:MAG TPA: Crp/Fnr family transcriptional regulator [Candidatus Sulfotelmatobacter sp.]
MASSTNRITKSVITKRDGLPLGRDESAVGQAAISTALAGIFRGKFCDAILPGRRATTFKKADVIYDVGDRDRVFFFLESGFVKVGAVTPNGREVIYDIRKTGEVVGELCAYEQDRPDRAVALEETRAVPVPYEEVLEALQKRPDLLSRLVDVFCRALSEAYEQVNTLATDDTLHRLVKVLLKMGAKIGRGPGRTVEIPTYLTQEEISQMVAARRERVSTALNSLRRLGSISYSKHGRLILDIKALEQYAG